jgi:hypothetical protein
MKGLAHYRVSPFFVMQLDIVQPLSNLSLMMGNMGAPWLIVVPSALKSGRRSTRIERYARYYRWGYRSACAILGSQFF